MKQLDKNITNSASVVKHPVFIIKKAELQYTFFITLTSF